MAKSSSPVTSFDTLTVTDISYGKLGMWLFLASEVMLFGSLFSALILLRTGAPHWPHGWEELNVNLATLNTVFLITSSVTMVLAFAKIKEGNICAFKGLTWTTVLLGCAFLVVKYFEYTHKFHDHHFPKTNLFFGTYFVMTGLHVLHVIGGLLVLAYHALPGFCVYKTDPKRFVDRIEVTGLYWHFVDLVWIFLFPTLYLL